MVLLTASWCFDPCDKAWGAAVETDTLGWMNSMCICCRHSQIRRQQVDKKTMLENLDLLLLVMDEVVDGG